MSVLPDFQEGGTVWNDRTYTFTTVPSYFQGAYHFQGPVRVPDGTVLTFTLPASGTLYALLAVNRDGGYKSALLSGGWSEMDEPVMSGDGDVTFEVFSTATATDEVVTLAAANGDDTVVAFAWNQDSEGGRPPLSLISTPLIRLVCVQT